MTIRHWLNYQELTLPDERLEKNVGISETVPDQSMSIRTLVDNYRRTGAIPHTGSTGVFLEDHGLDDLPDNFGSLDLVEKDEFLRDRRERIEAAASRAKQAADDKRREEEEAKIAKAKQQPDEPSKTASTNIP